LLKNIIVSIPYSPLQKKGGKMGLPGLDLNSSSLGEERK